MTGLARRLLGKKTCLCTTAKRDSLYDDPAVSLTKNNERQSADHYGFMRTDKPRRVLMRQTSLEESDGEDDMSITEKLRRATSQSPANIPMLVVVSFHPDLKSGQKQQIEIQRGFPVNAQYILNEWLFIKTADNDEGFVPYLCCRPMFRRQPIKSIEHSYKPYDFESNKSYSRKSPSIIIPTLTPINNKKLSLSTNFSSPANLSQKSFSSKKRQDMTSSSCGGDSGVSDCESSSNNNHHQNSDLSTKRSTRLSNIRSLRSSSSTLRKTGLIVQDLPLKKSMKTIQIKSQLLISSNSAFTQIVRQNHRQESNQRKSLHPNNRSFHHEQEMSSSKNNIRRLYESYDETSKQHPDNNHIISSPCIRRTPYTRLSLPHHLQSIGKKSSYIPPSSSSPDPFKIINEQQLRKIVLPESSLANIPTKYPLQKHFSDLSLNQIENDSLSPSTPVVFTHNRPSLSCSSSSATSSSFDGNTTPFIHIQMNNNYRTGRVPFVCPSSNINSHITPPTKSNSFIHNVSITV